MESSTEISPLGICVEALASAADTNWVNARLADDARKTIGQIDHVTLTIFLRDEANQLQGGLLGWTMWSWLHIDSLWVEEQRRGQGHGRRLLAAAEHAARIRGCKIMDLETFSPQVCSFYMKAGFTVIGTLKDVDGRFDRYYLGKVIG